MRHTGLEDFRNTFQNVDNVEYPEMNFKSTGMFKHFGGCLGHSWFAKQLKGMRLGFHTLGITF